MKFTKRLLAIFIAAMMLVGTMPMTAIAADEEEYEDAEIIASGECGLYVEWKLNSLGTLFLEGNGSNGATYDYPIEKNSPFRNDSRIKKIVVGEGVTYLGRMVFRDLPNLTEVVFYDDLREMEFGVFSGCTLLTELELPASFNRFTTVSPFYESGIKKLTFTGNKLNTNTESGYAWDRFFSDADIYVPLPFTLNGAELSTYEEAEQALANNGNRVHCVNDNATVKWKDYDGTVLETDENAEQGVIPTFDGETPSRASDNTNAYYFTGWSPEPFAVTGDMSYTATYGSYGKSTYIDENGEEQEVFARPLTGTETELPGGWYVAEGNITYSGNLKITGDFHLILADGATLSMAENCGISGNTDDNDGENISIYCQREKTGKLKATTLFSDNTNVYGGNITCDMAGIYAMNIYGGTVDSLVISSLKGYVHILGGNVNVSSGIIAYRFTFGYTNATDSIYVDGFSYWGPSEERVSTVTIDDGCTLFNSDNGSEIETFSGTVSFEDIQKKTLVPYAQNPITYVSGEHGTVKGSRTSQTSAYPRETVSFVVQPDQYYTLDTLTVKDALGNDVEVTITESHPSTTVTLKYYKFEMPITPVTVTATFKSTAHEVSYLDENGNEKTVTAYSLDENYTNYDGGWYVADKELLYSENVTFSGDAHIILADAASITVANNDFIRSSDESGSVNIYWQSGKTGALNAALTAGTLNIYGGNINAASIGGMQANIYDGAVNANNMLIFGEGTAVYGGNVNIANTLGSRNITFGYTHSDDSIYVNYYNSSNPVSILNGQTLTDGSGTYTNTVTASDLNKKTLRPYKPRTINYAASQNGTVSGSRAASVGNEVTPVVTPAPGYELDTLTVKDASENNVSVTDGKFTMPDSDVTVTATFKQTKYTVKWVVEGAVVETDENLTYGTMPEYNGATPSKQQDRYYTYSFAGWSPEITAVTDNVTYTAQFTKTAISFKIFVKKNTGETVTFDSVTGETTVAGVKEMLAAETGIPAAEQRLIFAGKELADDKTLAEYSVEKETTIRLFIKAYTITWKNGDEVLATDTVSYGDTPVYSGETPTKADDEKYTYTFAGWSPEIVAVKGDAVYTAQFTAHKKANDIYNLTVQENIDVNILVDVDGHAADGEEIEKIVYTYPDVSTQSKNTVTETVNAADITTDESGYFAKSFTMAIAQANEPINATIYFTDETTKDITVSVANYCKYIIDNAEANGYSDKLVNLSYAVLDYGKNAADYFNYECAAYPEYTLPSYFNAEPEIDSKAGIKKGSVVTGIASTQMFILSKATMRLTFKDDLSSVEVVGAKIGEKALTAAKVDNNGKDAVDISGIYATDLSKPMILELSDGTKVQYAATDWAKSILTYSTNAKSKALAKSLYYYSKAANDYFA